MTLPNFIIIGAAKSGTTSLAFNLADHPDVFMATGEPHFFSSDQNWNRGRAWYEAQFAKAGSAKAIGEKTPAYLFEPATIGRMLEFFPERNSCVYVAILREPTARALSQVEHRRREGDETRTVEQTIRENLKNGPGDFDYIGRGLYEPRLRAYFEAFGDDAVHVEFYDDLIDDPVALFDRLCRRLDLAPFVPPRMSTRFNESARIRYPRIYGGLIRLRAGKWLTPRAGAWVWRHLQEPSTYQALPSALKEELRSFYAGPNAALAALLGRRLPDSWG